MDNSYISDSQQIERESIKLKEETSEQQEVLQNRSFESQRQQSVQSEDAHREENFVPQFIDLDENYIWYRPGDSERMQEIRDLMKAYFKAKGRLEAEQGDPLLNHDRMVSSLESLISRCSSYCLFRHPFSKRGQRRKEEIRHLQAKAAKELQEARRNYTAFAESLYDQEISADPKLKKRRKYDMPPKEIKLVERGDGLQRLKLDKYRTLEGEYENHTDRTYLRSKATLDLERKDITLTEGQKKLLSLILSYSKREYDLRLKHVGVMKFFGDLCARGVVPWRHVPKWLTYIIRTPFKSIYNLGYAIKARYIDAPQEIPEYQSIVQQLKAIQADNSVSPEVKAMFKKYADRLLPMEKGNLDLTDVPADKIQEYRDYSKAMVSKSKKKSDGTNKEGLFFTMSDRRGEPLFTHKPCVSDIVQYAHGNCFYLAAVAELVAKDPQAVLDMFKDEGDNGVVVKLWHEEPDMSAPDPEPGQERPKKMQPVYFRVDKRVSKYEGDGALWVSVLSNAVVAYCQTYPEAHKLGPDGVKDTVKKRQENGIKYLDFSFLDDGGHSDQVFPILSGQKSETVSPDAPIYQTVYVQDVLNAIYEKKVDRETRKNIDGTKELFDQEYAVYEHYVKQFEEPMTINHYKDLHDRICQKMKDRKKAVDEFIKNKKRDYKYDECQRKVRIAIAKAEEVFEERLENDRLNLTREEQREVARSMKRLIPNMFKHYGYYQKFHYIEEIPKEYEYSAGTFFADFIDYFKGSFKSIFDEAVKANIDLSEYAKDVGVEMGKYFEDCGFKDEESAQKNILARGHTGDYIEDNNELIWKDESIEETALEQEKNVEAMFQICTNLLSNHVEMDIDKKDQKGSFKKKADAIRKLKYEDFPEPENEEEKKEDTFNQLVKVTGLSRQEIFDLAKEQALRLYTNAADNFDELSNSEVNEIFTGVYSDEALKLYERIDRDTDAGKLVAAGSRTGAGVRTSRGESKDAGTVGTHAYSVLGVQELSFEGKLIKMVRVRNPWAGYTTEYVYNKKTGKVMPTTTIRNDNGIFLMELTHFWKVFHSVYTESEGEGA